VTSLSAIFHAKFQCVTSGNFCEVVRNLGLVWWPGPEGPKSRRKQGFARLPVTKFQRGLESRECCRPVRCIECRFIPLPGKDELVGYRWTKRVVFRKLSLVSGWFAHQVEEGLIGSVPDLESLGPTETFRKMVVGSDVVIGPARQKRLSGGDR